MYKALLRLSCYTVVSVVFLFTGCATTSSPIQGVALQKSDEELYIEGAYMAGRFDEDWLVLSEAIPMFWIQFRNTESGDVTNVPFSWSKELKILEMTPGPYEISSIWGNNSVSFNPQPLLLAAPDSLTSRFTVERGRVTYIGDVYVDKTWLIVITLYSSRAEYNFAAARDEFLQKYADSNLQFVSSQ